MHAGSAESNLKPSAMLPCAGRILVVDDEWAIRDILETVLVAEGYEVECADGGAEALRMISASAPDVLITDLTMPEVGGAEVIEHFRRTRAEGEAIITTGLGAQEAAEAAVRTGAREILPKPFNFEHLKLIVARIRETQRLREENRALRSRLSRPGPPHQGIIGQSQEIESLRHVVRTVAASDATILMIGEEGSGREFAAREIHRQSARASRPWIAVKCVSIPAQLLEGELFGEAGQRPGWLAEADGGTVYLDGVTDLSMGIQAALLRLLEHGTIQPAGGEARRVNVRLIASAGPEFERMVDEGRFRRDLYHRLNVVPIRVPPLRERREDVAMLAAHLAEERGARAGTPAVRFESQAMACLTEYDWPGNIRELANLIERMAILNPGREIGMRDLPEAIRAAHLKAAGRALFEHPATGLDFNRLVDEYERTLIELALRKTRGVRHHAATLLNLKRTTLVEKMKKKRIQPEGYADLSQSGACE